ncbi:MAG: hypothetical protein KatS3mg027_2198 [Bacteroidia bacterium]|nr:MAG: hypothetical protein KatS3mg027_2198 [Bacteroidia bacterium]
MVINYYPNSKLINRALANKGIAEIELKEYEKAKESFMKIMNGSDNDDEIIHKNKGLELDIYANYKNIAAKNLSEIYILEENYNEALKYLELTKKYPYKTFCGNDYWSDKLYVKKLYAKCYLGLGDTTKALDLLMPHLIDDRFSDNSELVEIVYQILIKRYWKDDLKKKFIDAFKKLRVKTVNEDGMDVEYYYITFLNYELEVFWFDFVSIHQISKEKRKNMVENMYKNKKFYQLLENN